MADSDSGFKSRGAIHGLKALRDLDDGQEGNTGQLVDPVLGVSVPLSCTTHLAI